MMSAQDDNTCVGILGCIMDLYVSGTIGGSLQQFDIGRFTTDLVWYTFFQLLFGNIIKNIMIQSFSQLRIAREEMNEDKKNKCYICGKDRGMVTYIFNIALKK